MAIPSSFRIKYSLDKETYDKANVDAALSDLFAVSKKLAEENAIKKNTLEQLSKDYSTASVRAETLEGEVRRILAENEQVNRKVSFLEAENRSLKEKLEILRKNPPVSYEYEMIQKSVSATAAAAEKLLQINSSLNSKVEELEFRLDSLVSCFYGANRSEIARPAVPEEENVEEESGEDGEIEIELYEIPEEKQNESAAEEEPDDTAAAAEISETVNTAEASYTVEENKNPVSGVLFADEIDASEEPAEPVIEEIRAEEPAEPVIEEIRAEEPAEPVIEEIMPEEPAEPVIEEIRAEEPAEPVIEEIMPEEPAEPVIEDIKAEEPAEPVSTVSDAAAEDNELVSKIRRSLEVPSEDEKKEEPAAAPAAEPAGEEKAEDRRMTDMMSRLAAIRKKLEDKN